MSATASHTARGGAARAEPKGLAELYERNAPAAVRPAFLITSDRELAQDIAQEAFVRVAGRFRLLRLPEAFDMYLRHTVVNLCTSHLRHQRVERLALEREAARPTEVVDPPDLTVRDELRAALHRLPARQRTGTSCTTTKTCPRRRSPRGRPRRDRVVEHRRRRRRARPDARDAVFLNTDGSTTAGRPDIAALVESATEVGFEIQLPPPVVVHGNYASAAFHWTNDTDEGWVLGVFRFDEAGLIAHHEVIG